MTKQWRPEGWVNPHYTGTYRDIMATAFEDGADAMLENLRKHGAHNDASDTLTGQHHYWVPTGKSGYWVFIPDEPT